MRNGPGTHSYNNQKWCKLCEQVFPLEFSRCYKGHKLRSTPRCRKSKKARLELVVRY